VVRPTDANPLVQEHLAAGPLDRLAEMAILLFVNWNLLGVSAT